MYKCKSDFITKTTKDEKGNTVNQSLGYPIIVIDYMNGLYIQNTYKIMSCQLDTGYGHVFRDTAELRKVLKMLKIEEDTE